MGLSWGGSMDKGQAGDGGKRAEVRNGMVTIGRDGPGCWLGGGETPLSRLKWHRGLSC